MRSLKVVFVVSLCSTALFAADDSALHGVYVGDINKSVNPCVNFFDYANGAWRIRVNRIEQQCISQMLR